MHSSPLPPEVVRLILDADENLSLKHVVNAGQVSHSWRLAARSHPVFSRDIALRSESVDLGLRLTRRHVLVFLDRLAAVPGGNLHLKLELNHSAYLNESMRHDVCTMVLPALAASVPRLVSLRLECSEKFFPEALAALCTRGAPSLEGFECYVCGWPFNREPDAVAPTLPHDLFQGHAPLLKVLQLGACHFPAEGTVPACASVRRLRRIVLPRIEGYSSVGARVQLHPERFFANCPLLENLFLAGNMGCLAGSSWAACPPASVTRLRYLTVARVADDASTEAIVRTFAHADMLGITVEAAAVNPATIDVMLGPLSAGNTLWHLNVTGDRSDLRCTVLGGQPKPWISFTHIQCEKDTIVDTNPGLPGPEAPFLQPFARIAHRFTSAAVTERQYAWNFLAALFPPESQLLVGVQVLKLLLVKLPLAAFEPNRKLALPALTLLKLEANERMGTADVYADDLLFFMENMLDLPEGRRLKLVLQDVRLCGDTNLLSNYFEDIS